MSEHQNHEPPAQYRYAVGAGLGLILGVLVGVLLDQAIPGALIGVALGIVGAYAAGFFKP